VGCANR